MVQKFRCYSVKKLAAMIEINYNPFFYIVIQKMIIGFYRRYDILLMVKQPFFIFQSAGISYNAPSAPITR